MNCVTDKWSGGDYTEQLAEANRLQLDEINRLKVELNRKTRTIAILSQDRPLAEVISTAAPTLANAAWFGAGVALVFVLHWVLS